MSSKQLLYKDKPLFGLDMGTNSIKVMQLEQDDKTVTVKGYGITHFADNVMKDGEIVDYEPLAKAMYDLFDKHINGTISTHRVAATIPAAYAYARVVSVPATLGKKELDEAIRFEAGQYIPIPIDDLYIDFSDQGITGENREILVVAVPKRIVDSYMRLFDIVGLEVGALQTTIGAAGRLIAETESNKTPSILIDLGSSSVDLTIYDKYPIVNGTVPGGGDSFTEKIAERLNVSKEEAETIKKRYGLGISKKQPEIKEALAPHLDQLMKEIRRVVRYYEERTEGKSKIGQIVTMGGGANMPGLTEYLTDNLTVPCRMAKSWVTIHLHNMDPPSAGERSVYVTVACAALTNPKRIWK